MKKFKTIVPYIVGVLFIANLIWPGGLLPSGDKETTQVQAFVDNPKGETVPVSSLDDSVTSKETYEQPPYIYHWRVRGYFVRSAKVKIRAAPAGTYDDLFYVDQVVEIIGLSSDNSEKILAKLALPDETAIPVNPLNIQYIKRYILPR